MLEGYKVVTLEEAADKADIFVTATGNYHVITREHMEKMKDQAIVCNIGHFDNEIDVASLEDLEWEEIKPQVDHVIFPDGKRIILLPRAAWLTWAGNRPPLICDVGVVHQPDHCANRAVYPYRSVRAGQECMCYPSTLMKNGTLASDQAWIVADHAASDQAAYINVPVEGPYKPEHYRY